MKGDREIVLVAKSLIWHWFISKSTGQLHCAKPAWLINPIGILG